MTSTTYSNSKIKQALVIFLWTLKTNRAVIIVYLSILGFFAIINTMIGGVNENGFSEGTMEVETFATAMIIGLIVSIRAFSYLHSKRQTDLVGALPVSRRTMFFSRLFSASVISGVPLLIVFLILQLCYDGWRLSDYSIFYFDSPITFLKPFLVLIANIAMFGVLSICCGKTSEKIISFAGINIAVPMTIYALTILPATMVMGYTVTIEPAVLLMLSPSFAFIYFKTVYWVIFILACLVLSFFLIKSRKAESAQSHFAYKFPLVAIKVLVSFSAGAATGFMLVMMTSSASSNLDYPLFWIGMLIGSFLAHLIIQLIFNHGVKGFLKGLIPYGAMLLCFAVFFVILNTGFLGYESYVPNVDDIQSVSFTGNNPIYVDGVNILENEVTDKRIIKEAAEAHRQALKNIDIFKASPMFTRSRINYLYTNEVYSNSYILEEYPTNFFITYTLKDGRKVSRVYSSYYDYYDNNHSEFDNIPFLNTDDYKKNISPVFICDEKYLLTVDIETNDDESGIAIFGEKGREILNTFKKEYDKYGIKGNELNLSDYVLEFSYGKENKGTGEVYTIATCETITIPKSYKETIKLIQNTVKA